MASVKKIILVTGGAGFIGSHLVERLIVDPKNFIYIIDDLSTGRMANINFLRRSKNFKFIKGSILDSRVFKNIPSPKIIFHLAAAVGAKLVIEKPLDSFRTNILGTERVLDFALRGKSKVLITSSSEVYGKNTKVPFRETDDRVYGSVYNLRWGYALSKSCDELMAIFYHQEKNLPAVVVRLFNTIGPRQVGHYGMVVPNFIRQALSGKSLTIYGDGSQIRSFSDVRDVVGALISLAEEPKAVGRIFNVGSGYTISIKKLALLIKELTRSKSKLKFVPYARAYSKFFEEMMKRQPDLRAIKRLISFRPSFDLESTLSNIISHEAISISGQAIPSKRVKAREARF